jgi:hypothetical protein
MFFYIFHQINHNIRYLDDSEGAVNTRTLILGGIAYIITHAIISTPDSSLYFYKDYLWYFFLLDCCVMAVHYKLYFGRSILKELNSYETDEYDEKEHKYKNKKSLKQENIIKEKNVIKEENIVKQENDNIIQEEKSVKSSSKKSSENKNNID